MKCFSIFIFSLFLFGMIFPVVAIEPPLVTEAMIVQENGVFKLKFNLDENQKANLHPQNKNIQFKLTVLGKDDNPKIPGIQPLVFSETVDIKTKFQDQNLIYLGLFGFSDLQAAVLCDGAVMCSKDKKYQCDAQKKLVCLSSQLKLEYSAIGNKGQKISGVLEPLSKENCFDYKIHNPAYSVEKCFIAGTPCTVESCDEDYVCDVKVGCVHTFNLPMYTQSFGITGDCPYLGYYLDSAQKKCVKGCNDNNDCSMATPYCNVKNHQCVTENPNPCVDSDDFNVYSKGTVSGGKNKEINTDYCSNNNQLPAPIAGGNKGKYLVEYTCDQQLNNGKMNFVECNCGDSICLTQPKAYADLNFDGKVDEKDVLFIRQKPNVVWSTVLLKDINNVNLLVANLQNEWSPK